MNLLEFGRPIFLHFLDREVALAIEERRSEAEDISIIETLAICHCGGLSANLHPMALYFTGKPALMSYLLKLNHAGILTNTSHDKNIEEFIPARQQMYHNVRESVPIFFLHENKLASFTIHKPNLYSMTDLIRADIAAYSPGQISSFAPRATLADKWKFESSLDTIQRIVFQHRDAAITVDNIVRLANANELDASAQSASRRVLSALYQKHYSERNITITTTGVPRLISLLDDYTYFPLYDIPILTRLVRDLEWPSLENRVVGLREKLLETYLSWEHCRFVECLSSFLFACAAEAMFSLRITAVNGDVAPAVRSKIGQLSSTALSHAREMRSLKFEDILSFYMTARELLISAATFGAATWPRFRSAWEDTEASQSHVPPTGYFNLDRRLFDVRNQLRFAMPLAEREISDTLTLLAPLANLAQQAVHGNMFETRLTEKEFQTRIKHALRGNPQIGGQLEEHPHRGRGIADLTFRGIAIELKSVDDRSVTLEDCKRFANQTLSYSVAGGSRLSVLCVLDCSEKRHPPFPAEDGLGIFVVQRSQSPMCVVVVLIQGNQPRASSHSR